MTYDATGQNAELGAHRTSHELPPEEGYVLFDANDGEEGELADALAGIPNTDVQRIMRCNLHDINGAIVRFTQPDRCVSEVWATTASDPSSGHAEFCFLVNRNPPMSDAAKVDRALELLREARELVKDAGNKRTADRIRAAIASCQGARRIQDYRAARATVDA